MIQYLKINDSILNLEVITWLVKAICSKINIDRICWFAAFHKSKFNILHSLIALIPGNSFPSKYSSKAPPPVET